MKFAKNTYIPNVIYSEEEMNAMLQHDELFALR